MIKKNKVAEIELVYHNRAKASERQTVHSAYDAYKVLLKSWHKGKIELQEEFKILLLDNHDGCIGISNIAKGGLASCQVEVKMIFAAALKAPAATIILAHNHPSGHLEPSHDDKLFTRRCKEVGRMLGIDITDHIVVSKEGYWSLAEKCEI